MTKKADYIWFNGEMVPWAEAKVHVMSHALHYGTSVFEGVRCYDSHLGPVVFRHREHMQRLHDSAKIYRMPVSQSVDELMEACRATLRKNNLVSAYIRPLVFVGDVGMGVNPPAGYKTDVIIAAFPGALTWVKKRWIKASMRWSPPGTASHQTRSPLRPRPAAIIFLPAGGQRSASPRLSGRHCARRARLHFRRGGRKPV